MQTIGQRMERFMDDHFVGRAFETEYFKRFLEDLEDKTERILNVHGTAGMGKTYLLDRFANIARELGALPVSFRIGEAINDPHVFCRILLQGLGTTDVEEAELPAEHQAIREIRNQAEKRSIVLLLDGYEEAGSLDHWLRSTFLPELPSRVLVVIAGRYSLEGPWRHSPAWRRLIVRLPLAALTYEDIREYLRHGGTEDEAVIDAVWLRTLGYPLAMSLLAPLPDEAGQPADLTRLGTGETFEAMLSHWLEEAPDDELREWLFAASVSRAFQQELLGHMAGKAVPLTLFERLVRLSFVRRTAGGWQLHEIVWETLRKAFRERMPDTLDLFSQRAVEYRERKIEESIARGEDTSRDLSELLHFAGNPILRAHYRHARTSPHYREPLNDDNREEFEQYLERRKLKPRAWNVRCSDPATGKLYRFDFTPEESLLRLTVLSVRGLRDLSESAVQLLRSEEGRVIGAFAAVPVREDTWAFLSAAPVSRSLFGSLSGERLQQLKEAAKQGRAWYLYSVDVENLESDQLRSDIVVHLFDYVLAGSLILASPPPLAYYEEAQRSFGFETVPGADHDDYGTGKRAHTYWLDTRGERLKGFLRKMVGREPELQMAQSAQSPASFPGIEELTEREKEVGRLLAEGHTNQEIAGALFVSEAAVKKHVNAMLSKFGLKNRTQLAARMLGKS